MTDLVYAVGDIHGCKTQLDSLLALIYDDYEKNFTGRLGEVVFVGDYVDRGPDSKGVLDLLRKGSQNPNLKFVCLMGNHEDMMFDYFQGLQNYWLINGGHSTLKSFENKQVPQDYLDWISNLSLRYETDFYHFVHAGFEPKVDVRNQSRESMLWIRDYFLTFKYNFGKPVIHGHTPEFAVDEILPYRINIDTACVFSGQLTCAVLDRNEKPRYLQVKGYLRDNTKSKESKYNVDIDALVY